MATSKSPSRCTSLGPHGKNNMFASENNCYILVGHLRQNYQYTLGCFFLSLRCLTSCVWSSGVSDLSNGTSRRRNVHCGPIEGASVLLWVGVQGFQGVQGKGVPTWRSPQHLFRSFIPKTQVWIPGRVLEFSTTGGAQKNAPGRGDEVVYGFNFWTTDIDCFLRWIQLLQISTCIISCQSMHRVALHNSPHVNCQSFSRSMVDWSRRCSCNHHPLLQLLIPSWLIVLVAFLDCKCCQLHKLVIHRPWMNATTWDLQTLNQHQIIKQSGQCSVHFHPHPVTPGVFLFSLQVGPFSIPMVKLTNGLVSHANDLNPSSIHWLKKSVEMNKLPQVESWPAWFFFNFLGLFLALAGFDMSGNRSVS